MPSPAHRLLRRLGVVFLALPLLTGAARPAAASLLVLASPGHALHVRPTPTAAVHTAATQHRRLHHHHRHVRHHHIAQLSRHVTRPSDGVPVHPTPHRAERRAALPHVVRGQSHTSFRQGSRHAGALPADTPRLTAMSQRAETLRSTTLCACEHPLIAGRGPPRAGPFSDLSGPPSGLPACSAAPVVPFRAAMPPFTRPLMAVPRSAPRTAAPCALRLRRGRSFPMFPGRLRGCPLASRPEGAGASSCLPSMGDHS